MTLPSYDFNGQVVVVTGSASAAGAAIAAGFVAAGAQAVEEPSFGATDAGQPDLARQVVDGTTQRFGHLDVVIITAAPSPDDAGSAGSALTTEAIIGTTLIDPFVWAQAAHRVMVDQGGGGTVIVVSPPPGSGSGSPTSSVAVDAAWAGVINLTTTLAVEWAPSTRVVCISVGEHTSEQDVAQACLFLASQAAVTFSGSNVVLDGHPGQVSLPVGSGDPTGV